MKESSRSPNLWAYFLKKTGVSHTKHFISELYRGSYDHSNLYGFSKMLETYHIDHAITSISNNDIETLQDFVFVTTINQNVVLVESIDKRDNSVTYTNNGLVTDKMNTDDFIKQWNNIVIITDTDSPKNKEPLYSDNKIADRLNKVKWVIYSLFLFLFVASYFRIQDQPFGLLSLIVNLVGIYLSVLLIGKELNKRSSFSDRICSFIKNSDCNIVLHHGGSGFLRFVSLSNAGLAYFLFNVVIILFYFENIQLYMYVSILSLFFAFWSIWYQKYRVRQWCTLCLLVQGILFTIFIIDMLYVIQYGIYLKFDISYLLLLTLGLVFYFTATDVVNVLAFRTASDKTRRDLNYFKSNKIVIDSIFSKQKKYNIFPSSISIKKDSPDFTITLLLSLKCPMCKKMNDIVYNALKEERYGISISYIFFDSENNDVVRILINYGKKHKNKISISGLIKEWFDNGIEEKEAFLNKYREYNTDDEDTLLEIMHVQDWAKQNHLEGSPIIFLNECIIPAPFLLKDVITYHDLYTTAVK